MIIRVAVHNESSTSVSSVFILASCDPCTYVCFYVGYVGSLNLTSFSPGQICAQRTINVFVAIDKRILEQRARSFRLLPGRGAFELSVVLRQILPVRTDLF